MKSLYINKKGASIHALLIAAFAIMIVALYISYDAVQVNMLPDFNEVPSQLLYVEKYMDIVENYIHIASEQAIDQELLHDAIYDTSYQYCTIKNNVLYVSEEECVDEVKNVVVAASSEYLNELDHKIDLSISGGVNTAYTIDKNMFDTSLFTKNKDGKEQYNLFIVAVKPIEIYASYNRNTEKWSIEDIDGTSVLSDETIHSIYVKRDIQFEKILPTKISSILQVVSSYEDMRSIVIPAVNTVVQTIDASDRSAYRQQVEQQSDQIISAVDIALKGHEQFMQSPYTPYAVSLVDGALFVTFLEQDVSLRYVIVS